MSLILTGRLSLNGSLVNGSRREEFSFGRTDVCSPQLRAVKTHLRGRERNEPNSNGSSQYP